MSLFIGGHMDGRDVDAGGRPVVDFVRLLPAANLFDQVPTVPYQRESYQRHWYRISRNALAAAVGVTERTVRRWVSGEDLPSVEMQAAVGKWVRKIGRQIDGRAN